MTSPVGAVCVVGACVVDLSVQVPRLPALGETVIGSRLVTEVGGKGLNQAVASVLLGVPTSIVGRVGDDEHGHLVLGMLDRLGIDQRNVTVDPDAATGVGLPIVDDAGDNMIVLIPGANAQLTAADIDRAHEAITAASVLVLQLEVPIEASLRAAELASQAGCRVVLNAAPFHRDAEALRGLVDVLVVNEIEARQIAGDADSDERDRAAAVVAKELADRWAPAAVVVTLGAQGMIAVSTEGTQTVEAVPVRAVDTVAAGDAAVGVLAAMLARSECFADALEVANLAAAIAVTRRGSSSSLPTKAEVEGHPSRRATALVEPGRVMRPVDA